MKKDKIKSMRLTKGVDLPKNTLVRLSAPLIVYKKVTVRSHDKHTLGKAIATLRIPRGALVSRANSSKHRTSEAKVVSIDFTRTELDALKYRIKRHNTHMYGASWSLDSLVFTSLSYIGHNFKYRVGRIVRPKGRKFDKDPANQCASGIHFFRHRMGAIRY